MGNLKILLKLFKQNIIKNIVILIQIVFSIYIITTLLTEIIFNFETKELLNKNNFDNKIVFAESLHINNIMPMEGKNEKYQEIKEYLSNQDGIENVSNVYITQLQNQDFPTYLYDKELITDLYFDLTNGVNFSYNDFTNDEIPIIISENLKDVYKLNNVYDFSIIDLKSHTNMNFEEKIFKVRVIGILKNQAYIYGFSTNQFNLQSSDLFYKTDNGQNLIIMPMMEDFKENKNIDVCGKFTIEINNMDLFMANSYQNIINEGIGRFLDIETINQNFYTNFTDFYDYEIQLFLIIYLFIIISIGGYNLLATLKYKRLLTIYFINGMTWKKGIILVTIRNFLLIMLPTIIVSVIFNLSIQRYGIMMFNIKSILITTILYFIIFFMTTIGMVFTLNKIKPNEVLREVE